MRFGGRLTPAALQLRFDAELTAALGGDRLHAHVGLGPDTDTALIAIALAYPEIDDALIARAYRAFDFELPPRVRDDDDQRSDHDGKDSLGQP